MGRKSMERSFRTDERHSNPDLRPVHVPERREDVFTEARNLAGELPGWRILEEDESRGLLVCERSGDWLAPASRVTLTFESPEGIPSTTVQARSESPGGWLRLSRDRARLLEFMRLLRRRVG